MKITKRDAVRIAIAYGEIFDYPLTKEEVRLWAPYMTLGRYRCTVSASKRLLAIRKQREVWAEEKWVRARRVAALLRFIPTITLVGVTGGLTRSNAKAADDIDFLVVTAPGTIWVTRAITTLTLDLLRLRRRPADTQFQNLICLNMFMSEDGLSVPRTERDLFTAHEVLLMTPLWERGGAYRKFLWANRWVKMFLPNAWVEKSQITNPNIQRGVKIFYTMPSSLLVIVIWSLRFVEAPARALQLWYMQKRRTTEVIADHVIRFHPRDARVWIKSALGRHLARYNVPLDKIFYGR